MALFTSESRRDRRRRRATQRRTWLRLPFLPRGNRLSRRGERRAPEALANAATTREAVPTHEVDDDGQTVPNSAYAAGRSGRPLSGADAGSRWRGALRAVLAVVLVAALIGLGAALRYVARTRPEFAIRGVRLTPTAHVSEERLRQLAGVAPGQNLFAVDLNEVRRRVATDPWVRSVRVRRELPATISVEVEEYTPAALVALDALYLVDRDGVVFKRATPEEALGRPVITGIGRDFYLEAREESVALIREALAAQATYEATAVAPGGGERRRPPLGELHVDAINGLLLYTQGGTAVRLGRGEPAELERRLQRLDAVLAALQHGAGPTPGAPAQAQVIYLDNRAHPEHVTVRLAGAR